MAVDHRWNRPRSLTGTPRSPAITVVGMGSAYSEMRSKPGQAAKLFHKLVREGLDPAPQALDHPRRKRSLDERAKPGVIRRVHVEHVAGEGAAELQIQGCFGRSSSRTALRGSLTKRGSRSAARTSSYRVISQTRRP